MRRLATLSFAALLCALSGPALAANDGLAVLGLQEPQAPASAPAEAAPPGPAPAEAAPQEAQETASLATEPATPAEATPEPQFRRQEVDYAGPEAPGTIVIDTPDKFLFLVEPDGRALRYSIGVGRPGFEWAGVKRVSRKAEWPDWTPPPQMLLRRPKLPRHMDGGPDNPLGARALYLGSSLYRIHGTNEPSTIGRNVSSGCIRMRNEDVIDLYERVPVGAKVVVL
jgi:lipoprotein-anchoring transpeptidase ErfK/SrfK